MPDSSSEQRAALIRLAGLAEEDLAALWADLADDERADAIEELCELYGLSAGTLAADWYDELREAAEAPGRIITEPAEMPSGGLYRALIDELAAGDPAAALVSAQGEVQRIVANAHRSTITQLAGRDRAAAGWRRVGDGHNCDFCRMLIGRGAVYTDSTARFAAHRHCNCMAAPAFDAGRAIGVMPYSRPADRLSPAARARSAQRAREWIAAHHP